MHSSKSMGSAPRPFSLNSNPIKRGCSHSGFSLLELLTSVGIAALLITIAAPSFARFMANSDMKIQTTALVQSLNIARQTALNQGHIVQVCGLADKASVKCMSRRGRNRSWTDGWMLFTDINENGSFDASDEIVRVYESSGATKIVFNQNGRLRFFPNGSARSAGFYICNENAKIDRRIFLLHSGRTRSTDTMLESRKKTCQQSK